MSRRPEPARLVTASRGRALGFAVLLTLGMMAALFPWFPGGNRLAEGRQVERSITAPRDVEYESPVRTADVRRQAAEAVPDVLVLDPAVRDRQLAQLNRVATGIEAERRNTTQSASARETAIRAIPGADLSAVAARTLIAASEERFQLITDQAANALGRTLTGTVGMSDLDAARARSRTFLSPQLGAEEAAAAMDLLSPHIAPTQVADAARTEALRRDAAANTPPVTVKITEGQVVVPERTALSAAQIEALTQLGIRDGGLEWPTLAATALFALLAGGALPSYLAVQRHAILGSTRRMVVLAALLLVPAALLKFGLPMVLPDLQRHFIAYAIPIAAAPILAVVLLDVGVAVVLSMLLAGTAGFVSVYVPGFGAAGDVAQIETARLMLAVGVGSVAGVLVAGRAERLQTYALAGALSAGAAGVALVSLVFLDPDVRRDDARWVAGMIAANAVGTAVVSVAVFHLVRRRLGILTRVDLMELAQLNHPLLRRLQDEAPGTFQHSILVGNLAERAADRIGADALLVRVGAYYHDIGKLIAPPFFVENLGEERSPHDTLDPLQSTRVLHQHVTAGVELARRERLPERLIRFIPEHHGTRLAAFFYRRAAEANPDVSADIFRYPGPKPQSRETALVMLADASEAAVRAASDRSAERIRAIVEEVIRERLEEGEFDECDLTMRDLRTVADSYVGTLSAVYHPRVEYPEPTRRELATRGGRPVARPAPPRPSSPRGSVIVQPGEEDELISPSLRRRAAPAPRPEADRPVIGEDDA
ncbi:MAG: HDIG domain-containing protein [Chloroflexi bacterium]|nr:HDIG domain-containing protein [Chloroflexota bacterium]